jgi:hypothetical protein
MIEIATKALLKANWFKAFRVKLEYYFKDTCPNITKNMNREEYLEKSVGMIPKFYELNCK